MIMRQFDGLHSFSTGRTQADNCNDLLGLLFIPARNRLPLRRFVTDFVMFPALLLSRHDRFFISQFAISRNESRWPPFGNKFTQIGATAIVTVTVGSISKLAV